eukprot:g79844.t1
MGELIDSGVGGKVDPWTNEDVPDFPLDISGPGQAFPRRSVDLSFPQVFMVDQDGPSSSGGGRRRIDIEQLLNSEAEGGKVPWTQQDDFGRSMAAAPILSDMDNGRTRLEMDTEAPTERSAGLKRNRQDLDEKHCGGRKQPTMPDPQRGDKPAARLTIRSSLNACRKPPASEFCLRRQETLRASLKISPTQLKRIPRMNMTWVWAVNYTSSILRGSIAAAVVFVHAVVAGSQVSVQDPKIRNGGFLRFEVTVYGPDEPRYEDMPQYQDIDDLLSELIDRLSPAILCRIFIPHKLENYAENMRKQSKGPVFFYDSGKKTLDVIWSHNKLTKKVAGFHCQYDSYKTPKRLLRQIQLTSTNHTPILLVIATYCLLDKANEKILDFSLKDALQNLQGGLPPTKEALQKRPPQAKIAKLRADQRYVRGLKLYICSYSKEDCRVKREAEIRGSGKDIEISDEWLRPQSDSPVLDPIVFTDRQKKDELCPERWEVSLCQESRFLRKSLDDCAKKIRKSTVGWLKSKDEFFLPPRDRRPSRDMLLLQPGGYEACKFRESLFAEKRLAFINVRSAGTLSTVNGLFRLPLDLAQLIRECSNRRFRVMAEGHQRFWTPELNLDTAVWSSLTLRVYGSYHPECRSPLKKTKCAIA